MRKNIAIATTIDYAYGMWKAQGGFQAWSAYTNKSYLNHTEI